MSAASTDHTPITNYQYLTLERCEHAVSMAWHGMVLDHDCSQSGRYFFRGHAAVYCVTRCVFSFYFEPLGNYFQGGHWVGVRQPRFSLQLSRSLICQ